MTQKEKLLQDQHLPSGKVFIVPLHNGDCKEIYKEKLKEFYLNNLK